MNYIQRCVTMKHNKKAYGIPNHAWCIRCYIITPGKYSPVDTQ